MIMIHHQGMHDDLHVPHGVDHVVVQGCKEVEDGFQPFHVGKVGEYGLGMVRDPDDELGLEDGLGIGI